MNDTLSFHECRLSGGYTQTLSSVIKFIGTFCTHREWGY